MSSLNSLLTFSRASSAAFISSVDGTLVEVASTVPRFDPALGLLIENQRTNQIRNPRAAGLVPGVPGTGPTFWNVTRTGTELLIDRVGTTTINGITGAVFRIRVPSPLVSQSNFLGRADANFAASLGQVWTSSAYVALLSGTIPPGSNAGATVIERDSGGVFLQQSTAPGALPTATLTRSVHTRTMSQANVAFVQQDYLIAFPVGSTFDIELFLGAPQLEQGGFASSPILPPVGSPASTTRLADVVSAPLATLGIAPSGACTLVGTFVVPQLAPTGANLNILQIDDGTSTNRFVIRNEAATSNVICYRVIAGSGGTGITAGTITAGVPFRVAMSVDGAGTLAVSLNGQAVVTRTGGPTSGLTFLRVGGNEGNTERLSGYIQRLVCIPAAVDAAALPGFVP